MTTELVILLSLCVFVVLGIAKKPESTFQSAGPKLGARLEKQIETGKGFTRATRYINWTNP